MNIDEIVMAIDPERDYMLAEIAEMFPVSTTTLANYMRKGEIPGRQLFKRWYVKGKDIRAYLMKKCD